MSKSLHIARWVLPVIVGLLLFMPGPCVGGAPDCPVGVDCGAPVTRCHSLVGIPTSGPLALVGVPVVVVTATAVRRLREEWRACPSRSVPWS